ncbi:MAG: N-acetylmuramoyl-L-alanine amidase [Limnochordaceae bacterium]|nr:N-acetylmuramoyl-L-alanine amidase [Limnochordaceae bacterium]
MIAVDPGHGGDDGGVTHGGVLEKDVNLQVSLHLAASLERLGARVVMTRTGDDAPFTDPRTSLNLRLYRARQGEAQIFVSVHANSYPDSSQFGAQTFYHPSSVEGRRLALLVQEELVRLQPENYREALAADYYVLRNSQVPAALVEVGFLSNPDDRRKLVDPAYQARLGEAVARAIVRYFQGDVPEHRPTVTRPGPPPGFIQEIYPPEVR